MTRVRPSVRQMWKSVTSLWVCSNAHADYQYLPVMCPWSKEKTVVPSTCDLQPTPATEDAGDNRDTNQDRSVHSPSYPKHYKSAVPSSLPPQRVVLVVVRCTELPQPVRRQTGAPCDNARITAGRCTLHLSDLNGKGAMSQRPVFHVRCTLARAGRDLLGLMMQVVWCHHALSQSGHVATRS